ncbi:Aspartic peptidase family and Aspartic peptidase domain-containing protein [Aphelenchoides bicaudatus]|nr:Aspartic peptidase family and Aspartic peptidase domain-containing protein [Aphelenchoides bicaudatus]
MFLKLAIFACLFAITFAAVLKAPIHKRDTIRSRLLKEKKYEEFRLLNRMQLARKSGGPLRMDKISQPLYDYGDQEYNVRISIGTPGQQFELLPNTAGPTRLGPDDQDPCAGKKQFDSSASSSYSTSGENFITPAGLGNVSGVVSTDSFNLGDGGSSLIVKGTTFGLADRLSTSFAGAPFDGVLGLAFQAVSFEGETPFFQHGVDLGLFDSPIFTIYMKKDSNKDADVPVGSITFGGLNTDDCQPNYINVPLQSEVVWWFHTDGVKVNGGAQRSGPYVTMSSISTAINLLPIDVMFDLVDALNGLYDFNNGFYAVDCSTKFTWSLVVNGQEIKADETTMLWQFGDNACYIAAGSWEDDDHNVDMILGVPFLQNFCVSHDVQQGVIGFSYGK